MTETKTNLAIKNYLPAIETASLPGGLTLLGMEYDRVPWVSMSFMTKRGAECDPPEKAGLADWTAEYLTLGTTRRSQRQLAEDIESLGANLQARAEWDATMVHLDGLSEDFPTLLANLAEVVQTPSFPPEEFPLLQGRRRAELAQILDDPREVASRRFTRLFFQGAPYGHAVRGEMESLETLSLADVQEFYQRQFTPQTATLVIVGRLPFERMADAVEKAWSSWGGLGPPESPYTQAPEATCSPDIYLLDRPELTQSEIRVGALGLPRSHPDFFPLRLVNYVLGEGGFSSRLMARIRSDLGLTYGIRSQFFFRRAPGPFLVSTFTPAAHTAQVVQEIKAVMEQVRENGVTAQELEEAQSYYTGHFPLGLETPRALCRRVLSIDLYDLGLDYLTCYCERIRQVTPDAARAAAQAHLKPEELVTLVVGPASQCRELLAELGPVKLLEDH
jgi:zinc protease